jgi:hypothetical protein
VCTRPLREFLRRQKEKKKRKKELKRFPSMMVLKIKDIFTVLKTLKGE